MRRLVLSKYRIFKLSAFYKVLQWSIWSIIFIGLSFYSCDTLESVKPYQEQTFIKLFGGNGSEEGNNIIQLPDGGFVLVGSTTSDSHGGKDVFIVRTDKTGNETWKKNFGGTGDDAGNSVILGENNSLYVCGEKTLDNGLRDVYVINLNLNDGGSIGIRTFGDSLRDEYGTHILEVPGRGFFITGTQDSTASQFFLIETDQSLNEIDVGKYTGDEDFDNKSVKSFSLNYPEFVCFGSTTSKGPDVNQDLSNYYLFHYTTSIGNAYAPKRYYGGAENEICTDVFKTSDGGHVLTGYVEDADYTKEYIVRIDQQYSPVWESKFDNEYGVDSKAFGIEQTNDGGYIVMSTIELPDPANDEISLMKLDFNGDLEWRKIFGSNDDDIGMKVLQIEDGSFIVVGTMGFDINPDSRTKMSLLKINPNGDLVPL